MTFGKEFINNKRNIILILICIALISSLIVYKITSNKEEGNPNKNIVTVGQVARSISLLYHTTEECKNISDYFNSTSDKWYVPYMNAMYEDTYFLSKDIKPTDSSASSAFTYSKLEMLFNNIGIVDKELLSYVKNNKASNAIINSEWTKIYTKMVELLDTNNKLSTINMSVVGTISNVATLSPWNAVTTKGNYVFTGLSIDYYIDKEVEVIVRDKELLCVKDVVSKDVTYHNAWIIAIENGKIKAFVEGAIREFEINEKDIVYSSVVADIKLKNKKVESYTINSNSISGKVLTSGDSGIELENSGNYQLDENIKIYKTYGSMQIKSIKDILVGYDIQKFILNEEGKICAVAIDRDVNAKNIRVILKTTGHSDIYHDKVSISSEGAYEISYGSNSEVKDGKTEINLDVNSPYLTTGRIIITPQSVSGKIAIKSIERGYGTPSYRGTIEVTVRNGKLVIVNEIPIEQYLYCVVPSEMPYTYSTEALKSQAVCARSYAYRQVLGNTYSEYGAHVDDSTSFQVYNNSEERVTTTTAVDETYGQIMMCGDEIVNAFFYSTSCGSTTDATVWGGEGLNYIEGRLLTEEDLNIDLTVESNFDTFIRNQFDSFDSSYSWYRWSLKMSMEDITKTVNEVIGTLYNGGNQKVLTLDEDNQFKSKSIESVGTVKKVELGTRSAGGVLDYVIIYGTDATVKVITEGYIRKLFHSVSYEIIRNDGSTNSTFGMLPSAFVVIDPIVEDGVVTGYNFVGGGYGHGVGLSQNGANTMGNNGSTYEDILKFFYCNIEITKMY